MVNRFLTYIIVSIDGWLDRLDDFRAARLAEAAYQEWKRDPSIARPYAEFRAELVAGGLLGERKETCRLWKRRI